MSSWEGIKVKHLDGREGVIASDYTGFLVLVLRVSAYFGLRCHGHLQWRPPRKGLQASAAGDESGNASLGFAAAVYVARS